MIKIRRCQTRKARAGADIKLNDTSHLRCSKEVSPLTSGTPACVLRYIRSMLTTTQDGALGKSSGINPVSSFR